MLRCRSSRGGILRSRRSSHSPACYGEVAEHLGPLARRSASSLVVAQADAAFTAPIRALKQGVIDQLPARNNDFCGVPSGFQCARWSPRCHAITCVNSFSIRNLNAIAVSHSVAGALAPTRAWAQGVAGLPAVASAKVGSNPVAPTTVGFLPQDRSHFTTAGCGTPLPSMSSVRPCVNFIQLPALAVAGDRFSVTGGFRAAWFHRYTSFRSPIFTTVTIRWSSRIW